MREEYEIILEKEEREKLMTLLNSTESGFSQLYIKIQNAKVSKYCDCGEGLELSVEITNERCTLCQAIKDEEEEENGD